MITRSEVKYIQSLGHKKFRDELKQFVAEGPKIVTELLGLPDSRVKAIYATAEWWQQQAPLRTRLTPEMAIEVKAEELERISFLTTPNQVLGVFQQPDRPVVTSLHNRVSLMLDGLQDPGNMGTIIRIADWFGVQHIIASKESADVYNPKVVQATMGSIARVQVLYEDLATFIGQHAGIPVYAATLGGQPLASVGKIKEGVVLIGNESKGINEDLLKAAQHKITIPGAGNAESLNAAVAAGIILSHIGV
jgi:TrmH family RNA methyltransferase